VVDGWKQRRRRRRPSPWLVLGGSGAPVEREGKMRHSASAGWARGGQEGRGGRTRALSGLTHFGPKSEAEMGAHGQARTVLSVWVGPLGCGFPIFLSVQTRSDAGWSFGSAR
jgi:hypothetical protein